MAPPLKKQRLSSRSVPEFELEERLARSDERLKSIFESIFEKYERDFDGIGDEIDLDSGQIIVNNGHIENMANETDAGQICWPLDEFSSEDPSDESDDDSRASPDENFTLYPLHLRQNYRALEPLSVDQRAGGSDGLEHQSPDWEPNCIQQLNQPLNQDISDDHDEEADELAYSEQELLNLKYAWDKARSRFRASKNALVSKDEDSIEPAWRAPLLPSDRLSHAEPLVLPRPGLSSPVGKPKLKLDDETVQDALALRMQTMSRSCAKISASRESRYDENKVFDDPECHSIWATQAGPRRRIQRSVSTDVREPVELPKGSDSVVRTQHWTRKEEELLTFLKTTTLLTAKQMEKYFCKRNSLTIGSHWRAMAHRDKEKPGEDIECSPDPSQYLSVDTSPETRPFSLGLFADDGATHLPTPPEALSDDDCYWKRGGPRKKTPLESHENGIMEEQQQTFTTSRSASMVRDMPFIVAYSANSGSIHPDKDYQAPEFKVQTTCLAKPDTLQRGRAHTSQLRGREFQVVIRNSTSPIPRSSAFSLSQASNMSQDNRFLKVAATSLFPRPSADEKDGISKDNDDLLHLQGLGSHPPTAKHQIFEKASAPLPSSEDAMHVSPSIWQPSIQATASRVSLPEIELSPSPEVADSQHLRMITPEDPAEQSADAVPETSVIRNSVPIQTSTDYRAAFRVAAEIAIAVLIPVKRPTTQASKVVRAEPSPVPAVSRSFSSPLADCSDDDLSMMPSETKLPRSLKRKSNRSITVEVADFSDDELAL